MHCGGVSWIWVYQDIYVYVTYRDNGSTESSLRQTMKTDEPNKETAAQRILKKDAEGGFADSNEEDGTAEIPGEDSN